MLKYYLFRACQIHCHLQLFRRLAFLKCIWRGDYLLHHFGAAAHNLEKLICNQNSSAVCEQAVSLPDKCDAH